MSGTGRHGLSHGYGYGHDFDDERGDIRNTSGGIGVGGGMGMGITIGMGIGVGGEIGGRPVSESSSSIAHPSSSSLRDRDRESHRERTSSFNANSNPATGSTSASASASASASGPAGREKPGNLKKDDTSPAQGQGSSAAGSSTGPGSASGSGQGGHSGKPQKKEKQKRIAACDVCRMRKVKCVKENGATRCQGCVELNQDCSYLYMPKKPGPPNPYARPPALYDRYEPYRVPIRGLDSGSGSSEDSRIRRQNSNYSQNLPAEDLDNLRTESDFPAIPMDRLAARPSGYGLPPIGNYMMGGAGTQGHNQAPPPIGDRAFMQPSPSAASGSSTSPHNPPVVGMHGHPSQAGSYHTTSNSTGLTPLGNGFSADDNTFMPWIVGASTPAAAHGEIAHFGRYAGDGQAGASFSNPGRSSNEPSWNEGAPMRASISSTGKVSVASHHHIEIEDITSWSTVLCFLSLYHEHLYPLLPLTHWPSFSQELISRTDKKDDTFRAFLLSLVAYSILQLPRSVIPSQFSQEELVNLHQRCHSASRKLQARTYDPLVLTHICTLYCDHIYLGSIGKDNAANVVLAEAMRLAIALGLHDESIAAQQGCDAIEQETRKRVFWILYGSDRTIAALISCPLLLSDEDINVSDILAVDDSLITAAGAFPQPPNRTPILAGFVHVTRIFRLLSRVLTLLRRLARLGGAGPLSGDDPNQEARAEFPDPRTLVHALQLLLDDLPPPLRLQADGAREENTQNRSKTETNAFDTCKANILVSQVLVRFAIYQYAMLRSHESPDQSLDELTDDVLRRLHAMSSEALAANGESIRHKVLFIASSLLNKYPADNAGHDHVSEFLNVYNKILTNQTKSGAEEMDPSSDPAQMPVPESSYSM